MMGVSLPLTSSVLSWTTLSGTFCDTGLLYVMSSHGLQRLEPPRGAGWEPRGSRWRAASQAARSRCTES